MAQLSSCLERVVTVLTSSAQDSCESKLRELIDQIDLWISAARNACFANGMFHYDEKSISDFVGKAQQIYLYSSELESYLKSDTFIGYQCRFELVSLSKNIRRVITPITKPYLDSITALTALQNADGLTRKTFIHSSLYVLNGIVSDNNKFKCILCILQYAKDSPH